VRLPLRRRPSVPQIEYRAGVCHRVGQDNLPALANDSQHFRHECDGYADYVVQRSSSIAAQRAVRTFESSRACGAAAEYFGYEIPKLSSKRTSTGNPVNSPHEKEAPQ
jgi:hypothetical protein